MKPKPKVEPPPAQETKGNESQPTGVDSEMQDTSDSQKAAKREQPTSDQAPSENMETN